MNRRAFVAGLVASLVVTPEVGAARKNRKNGRDQKVMTDKIRARLYRKCDKAFRALEENQGTDCHWFVAPDGTDYTPFPDDDMSGIAVCADGSRFEYSPDDGFTPWNDCYRDQGKGYHRVTDWSVCFPGA